MSTRCQVRVYQKNGREDDSITLYHHTDGYPSGMVETFIKAYNYKHEEFNYLLRNKSQEDRDKRAFKWWRKARSLKVAGYLCWSDPGVYEPLPYDTLHGDIEYFYEIGVSVSSDGETPVWLVNIYERDFERDKQRVESEKFWNSPTVAKMKRTHHLVTLDELKAEFIK